MRKAVLSLVMVAAFAAAWFVAAPTGIPIGFIGPG